MEVGKFIFNIKEISQRLIERKRPPESPPESEPVTSDSSSATVPDRAVDNAAIGQMPELGAEISSNGAGESEADIVQSLSRDEHPAVGEALASAPTDIQTPGEDLASAPTDIQTPGEDLAPAPTDIPAPGEDLAPAPTDIQTPGEDLAPAPRDIPAPGEDLAPQKTEPATGDGSPVEVEALAETSHHPEIVNLDASPPPETTEHLAVEVPRFFSKIKEISQKLMERKPPATSEVQEDGAATTATEAIDETTTPISSGEPLDHGSSELLALTDESSLELAPEITGSSPVQKPLYRRRYFWVGLGGFVLVAGAGSIGVALWKLDQSLPNTAEIFSFVRDGSITISASDGTILQQIGPATREKLKIDKIPQRLIEAFIASEDSRFYKHHGIDYQGIIRATVSNILAGEVVQGASTITQQLARVVFLTQERNLGRKLREAMLAMKLEREVPKEQLLEQYLNHVYLGSGAYGVADAAWVYFSKSVQDLTLAEMATIAGLPPAPSDYSPLENPNVARERRNLVLKRMVEVEYLTAAEAAAAAAEPLAVKPSQPKRLVVEAPYFTSYVLKELPKYVSADDLEVGGLTVETTINRQWQKMAEEAVKEVVELDGPMQGFDQGALVAIDPRNGEVKAMVGGRDYVESEFNRVTQAQRQPGSTFKGFVYATAIAAGFSPYDGYEDANFIVDGYKPRNYSGKYRGWMSMRDALASSINVVAVKALIDVGFAPVIKLAREMGIKSELKPTYSLALGGSEVNLLELTSAYGTIAARGKYVLPHGIVRVTNRRGQIIYQAKFQPKAALDADTASIMDWMLEGVVNYGTGGIAQLYDRPVAGKTGTSDEAKDLWFIGYIPQMVAGVWLGNDDSYPTWGSSSTAAYAWRLFMEKAVKGMAVQKFPDLPKLDDRKATIKAQPVTPEYTVYGDTTPDKPEDAEKIYDGTGDGTGDSTGYY